MDTGCLNASPTIPPQTRSTRTTILSVDSISRSPTVTVTRVSERRSLISLFATPHVLREKPEGTRGTRQSVPPPRADGHGSSRGTHLVRPTPGTSDDSGCSVPVRLPAQAPAKGIRTRTPCPLGSRSRTSHPIEAFRAVTRRSSARASRTTLSMRPRVRRTATAMRRPLPLRFFGVSAGLAAARSGADGADRFRERGLTRPKSQNSRHRNFSLSVRSASMNSTERHGKHRHHEGDRSR